MRHELVRLDVAALAAHGRDVREIALPRDIVELRATDRPAAIAWRLALRERLQDSFGAGYHIVGVSASDGYVLERKP
jgi:predicted GNAT superfamily acetyltransferase